MSNLLHKIDLLADNIPWLHDFRKQGGEVFVQKGIPNAKAEAWKYTKPQMFFNDDFEVATTVNTDNYRPNLPFDCYKMCFINGIFAPQASDLPQEIEILPIIEAVMFKPEVRQFIGELADAEKYPFAALNAAYLNEGVYIHINSKLDKPLAIIYHFIGTNNSPMFNFRNLIILDEKAQSEIVEYYDYDADLKARYFNNTVNEIYIGKNAKLDHYKVQNDAFKAINIALQAVKVENGGNYKSFCLQKGADLARNESKVKLIAEQATAQVDAAYIMNGWAVLDTTTDIEHLACNTNSSQLVKGVVGGQAKGVFQGTIHIAPNCIKTEGYQQHRALLLSDDAEVDVKPELEIFADDVKCTHGSAVGQIDAEQLFYMRSRGIDEETAKQLLINAYLNEVIAKVDNEKIADWIKLIAQNDVTQGIL